MALKKKIQSLDDVGQEFRHLYVKKGGAFILDLEAADDDDDPDPRDAKLAEFRNNNIKLKKELDELKKTVAGIDMDLLAAGKQALDKARNDEERKLLSAGKFDDVVAMRLKGLQDDFAKKEKGLTDAIAAEKTRAQKLHKSLRSTKIESELSRAAAEAKLQLVPTAVKDFYRRGFDTFDLDENGELVAVDADGNPRVTKDQKPFDTKAFLQEIVDDAPHMLASAEGSSIRSNGDRPRRNGVIEIDARDPRAFGSNLENIANGKVTARVTE
ncbi:MAG: hypothetical protein E6R03_17375 [Hyphomicrobiaceae bacterium]|nr:MAG: hypothetical protein E6R03_17375 [Hyphomicrobiaceae bacterium]